jgi:phospholipid N-methyltransferase
MNTIPMIESTPANRRRFPDRREQVALFAKNFFKHPKMLGSIIPSSRFLINRVLRLIDWQRAQVVVEYGPGVGTFTSEILDRMGPDGALIVLETNADFVAYLRHAIPDERLHVVHGSAADVQRVLSSLGLGKADYVISGIPFSVLPPEVRESILKATRDVLQLDGAFLVYQFSPKVLPYLERVFSSVNRDFEPLNVLPAQVFYSRP